MWVPEQGSKNNVGLLLLQEITTVEEVGTISRSCCLPHTPLLLCYGCQGWRESFTVVSEKGHISSFSAEVLKSFNVLYLPPWVSNLWRTQKDQHQTAIATYVFFPPSLSRLLHLGQKGCYGLPHSTKLSLGYLLHPSLFFVVNYINDIVCMCVFGFYLYIYSFKELINT